MLNLLNLMNPKKADPLLLNPAVASRHGPPYFPSRDATDIKGEVNPLTYQFPQITPESFLLSSTPPITFSHPNITIPSPLNHHFHRFNYHCDRFPSPNKTPIKILPSSSDSGLTSHKKF
ncbi:hypothetical protein HanRHA438_Chr12g0566801 [Helianthus annuus]|nr:hypothetical protein HanHA300_Chr12g0455241 [Helianthus annuus]KAJ0506337.1 hypothetical protein HanHA89_Chr12g0480821 [Helianthus annuus]KAJ0676011.1 hypothetical protein HanLR1_Chr12g0457761 [Helianthus annuus]KAJ0867752.1 hypothetical protein HanRHA438_Chr12g0566801 [Helianthus annuus]